MVTAILLPCLVWQPALAAGAVVAGGQERITVVGKAANGVERIDIAAPNSKGLSHNLYQDFNVDKQGVILNNATSLSKTELGGYVQANPHLSRGAASLILNEVTSRNPSVLGGYMEVAGKKAGVVVANPNGITCDGCGFINTSRGTFTTGKPQLDANGALWGFDVQNGLITFDGQGFNAKGLDQFDVVSRVIKINAELYADRLNLITGKQQVDYATLATHVGEPATDAPAVAIDSSELGGIYANRISLVSTEQGVGVSLNAPVAALTGDVSLSADGKIRYDQMSAAGNITVNGTDLEGSKDVLAGGALNITGDSLTQSAGTLGGNNVSLSVSHDISLTSDTKVAAKRGLVVSASTISGYADAVLSARDLSLSVGNDLSFDHEIDWQGNVKLTTLGVINVDGQGALIAQGGLNLEAAAIVNDGDLVSLDGGMSLTSAGDIRNTGLIYAAQDVHVKLPGTFTNGDETTADIRPAAVYVGGDLSISDGKGGRAVAINNNASLIQSQGDMELKADEINNNRLGIVISDPQTSKTTKTVQTGRNHRQTAVTTTTSYTFIERGTPGQILSGANADVEADAINNNQSILSASEVMTVNGSYAGNSRDLISNTHVVTTYMYRDRPKGSNHHHWYTDSVVPEDLTPVLTDSIGSVLGASILHMTGNVENGAPVALVPSYKPPSSGGAALNLDNLLNNALSKVNREPGYPYFIESRYQFVNLNGFKGSEYMLGQLGWTPDDTTKLLGDAFTELSLARQELNALGLPEVAALDNEQLMRQYADWVNAGLYASNELQLAPGISLTADQVNALTQDIIWPVEKTIAGVRVMVPTLFLARTSADLNRSGSIIAADVIDINGDNITNGGQMRATGDITLHGSDINLAGSVTAGGDIDANATHDLNLSSAQVAGQDVTLHGDHNVTLETAATTHVYDNYGNTVTRTDVGQQASVNASGKLAISAGNPDDSTPDDGGDLVINGVKLSGNQVSLDATHDISLGAVQDISGHDVSGKRTHDTEVHVNNIVTEITSTLDTLMRADHDITLLGSDLDAGGDLQLAAKGDVTVANVTDSDYHYRRENDSKWYGSKTTTLTRYDESVVGPGLSAGGDLLINTHKDADGKIVINDDAKGNVSLVSANVHSGGDTAVYAGGDLNVGVATESHYHASETTRSYSGLVKGAMAVVAVADIPQTLLTAGVSGGITLKGGAGKGNSQQKVIGATLSVDGNTALWSGRDITLVAPELSTGGLTAEAGLDKEAGGGNIWLVGAHDTSESWSHESSASLGIRVSGGSLSIARQQEHRERESSSTFVGTRVNSLSDTNLKGMGDVTLLGSSINSKGGVTIDAGGDVNLLAAVDTSGHEESNTEREFKLQASASGHSAELFAGYEENRHAEERVTRTVIGSNINAANISVASGNDINVVGSNLTATYDPEATKEEHITLPDGGVVVVAYNDTGNITLDAKRDINTLASLSDDALKTIDENFRAGLAIGARENVSNAADAVGNVKGQQGGVNTASATLQAVDAVQAARNGAASASAGYVAEWSRNESEDRSKTSAVSVIHADKDLAFTSGRDQHHQGTEAVAGNNLTIDAGGKVLIESAQNISEHEDKSTNASLNIGLSTSGIADLTLAGGYARNSSEQTQQVNAHFVAGNQVSLTTAGDTTLAGATVKGDSIDAHIGGNLTVESRQDTGSVRGESAQASVTISLTGADGSLGVGGSHTKGDSAWVNEQSGLFATGTNNVYVENHTRLIGGVINSDSGDTHLDTGSLSYQDIYDYDHFKSTSANVGFGMAQGNAGAPSGTANQQSQTPGVAMNSLQASYQEREREQVTRATVGAGTLTVRDDLANGTDSTQGLNRDINRAQQITKDIDHSTNIYASDTSLKAVGAIKSDDGSSRLDKLLDTINPVSTVSDVVGSSIEGIDKLDNALAVGLTLGQARPDADGKVGLLDDKKVSEVADKTREAIKQPVAQAVQAVKGELRTLTHDLPKQYQALGEGMEASYDDYLRAGGDPNAYVEFLNDSTFRDAAVTLSDLQAKIKELEKRGVASGDIYGLLESAASQNDTAGERFTLSLGDKQVGIREGTTLGIEAFQAVADLITKLRVMEREYGIDWLNNASLALGVLLTGPERLVMSVGGSELVQMTAGEQLDQAKKAIANVAAGAAHHTSPDVVEKLTEYADTGFGADGTATDDDIRKLGVASEVEKTRFGAEQTLDFLLASLVGAKAARGSTGKNTAIDDKSIASSNTKETVPTAQPQRSNATNKNQYQKEIETPYGAAHQASDARSLAARNSVEEGATLYRIGTTGKSQAAEAQFWSLESPDSVGYAEKYGIPKTNVKNANFIETATVKSGTPFITRPAPGVGSNTGGGIEVVVPQNGVQMKSFHYGSTQ